MMSKKSNIPNINGSHFMNWRELVEADDYATSLIIDPFLGFRTHKMTNMRLRISERIQKRLKAVVTEFQLSKNYEETFLNLVKDDINIKKSIKTDSRFKQHMYRYLLLFDDRSGIQIKPCWRYASESHVGAAIFATRDWIKGSRVDSLIGCIAELNYEEELSFLRHKQNDFSVMYSSRKNRSQLWLGPAAYVNHDCQPNCEFTINCDGDARMSLEVLSDIKNGDEIFIFYGKHFFEANNKICECFTCEILGRGYFLRTHDDASKTANKNEKSTLISSDLSKDRSNVSARCLDTDSITSIKPNEFLDTLRERIYKNSDIQSIPKTCTEISLTPVSLNGFLTKGISTGLAQKISSANYSLRHTGSRLNRVKAKIYSEVANAIITRNKPKSTHFSKAFKKSNLRNIYNAKQNLTPLLKIGSQTTINVRNSLPNLSCELKDQVYQQSETRYSLRSQKSEKVNKVQLSFKCNLSNEPLFQSNSPSENVITNQSFASPDPISVLTPKIKINSNLSNCNPAKIDKNKHTTSFIQNCSFTHSCDTFDTSVEKETNYQLISGLTPPPPDLDQVEDCSPPHSPVAPELNTPKHQKLPNIFDKLSDNSNAYTTSCDNKQFQHKIKNNFVNLCHREKQSIQMTSTNNTTITSTISVSPGLSNSRSSSSQSSRRLTNYDAKLIANTQTSGPPNAYYLRKRSSSLLPKFMRLPEKQVATLSPCSVSSSDTCPALASNFLPFHNRLLLVCKRSKTSSIQSSSSESEWFVNHSPSPNTMPSILCTEFQGSEKKRSRKTRKKNQNNDRHSLPSLISHQSVSDAGPANSGNPYSPPVCSTLTRLPKRTNEQEEVNKMPNTKSPELTPLDPISEIECLSTMHVSGLRRTTSQSSYLSCYSLASPMYINTLNSDRESTFLPNECISCASSNLNDSPPICNSLPSSKCQNSQLRRCVDEVQHENIDPLPTVSTHCSTITLVKSLFSPKHHRKTNNLRNVTSLSISNTPSPPQLQPSTPPPPILNKSDAYIPTVDSHQSIVSLDCACPSLELNAADSPPFCSCTISNVSSNLPDIKPITVTIKRFGQQLYCIPAPEDQSTGKTGNEFS